MIEYVLVTVKVSSGTETDMEIPAQVDIWQVSDMLLETYKTLEPMLFSGRQNVKIKYRGKVLESGTLFENKVWDGSIIEVI